MKQQHLRKLKTALHAAKVLSVAVCLVAPAAAQQSGRGQNNGRNNGQNNGGVIPLPKGVRNVISIDAHNTLLAEVEDDTGQNSEYVQMQVRHVYSGGIAKILGGTVIPTEQFVSPAFNKQGGFGNNGGNNGFQGAQPGFNGGNFNGGNFGNQFGNGFNNGFGAGFGNGFGVGNTTITAPNGATGTLPNFGGFSGNGQVVPQNFAPQSTLNRPQPRISVNTGNRGLNQILGFIDRPLPQVEVGTGFGSTSTNSSR